MKCYIVLLCYCVRSVQKESPVSELGPLFKCVNAPVLCSGPVVVQWCCIWCSEGGCVCVCAQLCVHAVPHMHTTKAYKR